MTSECLSQHPAVAYLFLVMGIGMTSHERFCVEQSDSADSIALLGEILGAAGVNLEGLCLVTDEG
jgi:hypothetical protein